MFPLRAVVSILFNVKNFSVSIDDFSLVIEGKSFKTSILSLRDTLKALFILFEEDRILSHLQYNLNRDKMAENEKHE